MTHEFKEIITQYILATSQNKKVVLVTLVALKGSSYRKEGVRMLVLEHQEYIGAVSGGCVEKEIIRQAQSVFKTGQSKIICYDGRFRLGCEGTMYLLLEELMISEKVISKIQHALKYRLPFELISYYPKEIGNGGQSFVKIDGVTESLSEQFNNDVNTEVYTQALKPIFQLYIFGAEHDASSLSKQAAFLGWEVTIVNTSKTIKSIADFEGAKQVLNISVAAISELFIDEQTAVVLMNHHYAKDLRLLAVLKNLDLPMYIGILGAKNRKEQLLNDLIENDLNISESFLELIHGPVGLNIGSETPQEIAVSIVSELISLQKKAI